MDKKKQRAAFTAIHESSHHLLAWLNGCKLGKISIQSREDYEGVSESFISESRKSFHGGMFTPARALELMAGRAGTEVFCPDIDPAGTYRNDFENVNDLNGNSEIFVAMNQWRLDHPDGDVENFYQAFKAPIIDILQSEQGKRAIRALAKGLSKAGYLSGRESARILETAWGAPLPPLALPSESHPSLDVYTPAADFNDFLFQMSIFAKLLRKEVTAWIGNDDLTLEQQRIAEDFSVGVNHLSIVLDRSINKKT